MQSEQKGKFFSRQTVTGIVIFAVVLTLSLAMEYIASQWQREQQIAAVTQKLGSLRANLEFELYTNIELMRGVEAYVSLFPELTQEQFGAYISRLLKQRNNVVNVGGARDFVINLIYPVEGNRVALGLNYRNVEAQREAVFLAADVGVPVLTGPVELVQGGLGLVARMPVTVNNQSWGIISVVLDYNGILDDAGLTENTSLDVVVTEYSNNQSGAIVYQSNPDVSIVKSPVTLDIQLPYGEWRLTAQPKTGWINYDFHPVIWLFAALIGVIAFYISQLRFHNAALQQKAFEALTSSERKFRQFFSDHAVAMLIIDGDGNIIDANDAAATYYGYSSSALCNKHVKELQIYDAEYVRQRINEALMQPATHFVSRHLLASGEVRDVEVFTTHVDSNGSPLFYSLIFDITERLSYQKRWELSQHVFSHSLEGIIVTDEKQNIISVNPAFTEITGYQFDEVEGKKPIFLGAGLHDSHFIRTMIKAVDQRGFWRGEVWNRRKDGSIFPELLSISVVKDDQANIVNYIAVFSDITNLKQSEEKLEKLAHYDALTGLPNRVQFQLHLQHAVSRCERSSSNCALLYLDLDRFKVVNDSLGHIAGDDLLKSVTGHLTNSLRASDILARMGGDEFVLLVEAYKDDAELITLAKKLIAKMNQPFYLVGEQEVNVGVSVGIARFPLDCDNHEDLLVRADAAMYRAKQAGGANFAFFTQDILVEASSRLTIASELKRAIAEQELELYFQPQMDSHTGQVVGAEALLRWNHPTKGFLTPAAFIDVAEQTRAIRLVTGWLVKEIAAISADWRERGLDWFLAFNVSALDLSDNDLVQSLGNAIEQYQINPARIELEIVESAIIENFQSASAILSKLRELGFCVAIDDFGTGYSSLAYLDKLPVDKLKIDREFISKLAADGKAGVVKSIIDLATNFNLRVVAEGVETVEQERLLNQLGCSRVQGFYYSKPLSLSEFEDRFINTVCQA